MGMFDWYEPRASVVCRECGNDVREWQGKGGPNALLVWVKGERHAVDQRVDDDTRTDEATRRSLRLPDNFIISGWCPNGHRVDAACRTIDGVWTETVVRG